MKSYRVTVQNSDGDEMILGYVDGLSDGLTSTTWLLRAVELGASS